MDLTMEMPLHEVLRKRRRELHLTQSQVSARTGGLIGQSQLSDYERGLVVKEDHRALIAEALERSVEELFGPFDRSGSA